MVAVLPLHLFVKDEGRPHIAAAEGEVEIFGHHADNLEGFVIQHHLFAHYLRLAAKTLLPEAMFEHGDLRVSRLVFASLKSAPQLWPHAERVKEGGRYSIAEVTLRRPLAEHG